MDYPASNDVKMVEGLGRTTPVAAMPKAPATPSAAGAIDANLGRLCFKSFYPFKGRFSLYILSLEGVFHSIYCHLKVIFTNYIY